MITKEEKAEIIKRYASTPKDTGQTAVQIAIISKRMEGIGVHLKSHKYDHSSRRGLVKLVSQRRSLLGYFEKRDSSAAKKLRADLDLK